MILFSSTVFHSLSCGVIQWRGMKYCVRKWRGNLYTTFCLWQICPAEISTLISHFLTQIKYVRILDVMQREPSSMSNPSLSGSASTTTVTNNNSLIRYHPDPTTALSAVTKHNQPGNPKTKTVKPLKVLTHTGLLVHKIKLPHLNRNLWLFLRIH